MIQLNKKKAELVFDFFVTYGWAIFVVLVAIGVLAYFGVLNPANWTQNRPLLTKQCCEEYCQTEHHLECYDYGIIDKWAWKSFIECSNSSYIIKDGNDTITHNIKLETYTIENFCTKNGSYKKGLSEENQ